jgi:hypothetical protein
MDDKVVVHSVAADAEPAEAVAGKLRSGGVEIMDQQPHMLLVSGTKEAVGRVLGKTRGWSVTELTKVPPPRTRVGIRRKP